MQCQRDRGMERPQINQIAAADVTDTVVWTVCVHAGEGGDGHNDHGDHGHD